MSVYVCVCECVNVCVCVCMYTATGHNNSVLSLDVHDELMITGSKGTFHQLLCICLCV